MGDHRLTRRIFTSIDEGTFPCMSPVCIEVAAATRTYQVLVGAGLLDQAGPELAKLGWSGRGVVIADDTVAGIFGDRVVESLENAGLEAGLLTFPPGEASKSLETVGQLAEEMAELGLDRQSFVVALGGGVTGDVAGFLASIYYRGIPYVQVPTTVTAQVDSSVGGKTGVNLRAGKNLAGAFYPPSKVLADIDVLHQLPKPVFNEGCAEIIKHGVIRDAQLIDDVCAGGDWQDIVARNVRIKAAVVAADETEKSGLRMLLNFGHTLGHAIEAAAGYGGYLHGEAVSLGIVAALRLSVKHAGLSEEETAHVVRALEHFQLPVRLDKQLDPETVMRALARDKKFSEGRIRFVLTPRLGEAFVSEAVTLEEIRETLTFLGTL